MRLVLQGSHHGIFHAWDWIFLLGSYDKASIKGLSIYFPCLGVDFIWARMTRLVVRDGFPGVGWCSLVLSSFYTLWRNVYI